LWPASDVPQLMLPVMANAYHSPDLSLTFISQPRLFLAFHAIFP